MTWPNYSPATRKAVNDLLKRGGSLSAYRANKDYGAEPCKDSYAWRLEREIERRFHVKHAVAVNSGTAGLHCALVAAGITSGEVITSPYSFSATVSAILLAGAVPVFADVDPHTFTINPETVNRVVTKRTRCILPVDLFGGLAAFEGDSFGGIPIIRDSCQAVGAVRAGKASGSDAVAAAYSFNGGKNVPAGEAGAMICQDAKVAEKARLLMNHAENFGADYVGLNYRPNEVTCCIAYHGLLELEERNEKRRLLAQHLTDSLLYSVFGKDFNVGFWAIASKLTGHIAFPAYPGRDHVFYVYPFLIQKGREEFIQRMKRKGVHVGAGYINPTLEKYKAFKKYARGPLPVVTELSEKTLCLLYDLTPDKPLSYAAEVARKMRECLE